MGKIALMWRLGEYKLVLLYSENLQPSHIRNKVLLVVRLQAAKRM
jgi:hypothetical protein